MAARTIASGYHNRYAADVADAEVEEGGNSAGVPRAPEGVNPQESGGSRKARAGLSLGGGSKAGSTFMKFKRRTQYVKKYVCTR